MTPTGFKECNCVFKPHPDNADTVGNLPVYKSPRGFNLAVFDPTPEERQAIADGGKIALAVWAGNQQPPVCVAIYTPELVSQLETVL